MGPMAMELLKLRRPQQLDREVWIVPAHSSHSEKGCYADPTRAMRTVKEMSKVEEARGHDLRRTFGAAREKLGLSDRQTKWMLGHSTGGGELDSTRGKARRAFARIRGGFALGRRAAPEARPGPARTCWRAPPEPPTRRTCPGTPASVGCGA
jgi:hypothetical protein